MGADDSAERPADRAEVARLYAATSPTFALSMAARQIAAAKGLSLSENARAFALIMMGSQRQPHRVVLQQVSLQLWRPETAIRLGADGRQR